MQRWDSSFVCDDAGAGAAGLVSPATRHGWTVRTHSETAGGRIESICICLLGGIESELAYYILCVCAGGGLESGVT